MLYISSDAIPIDNQLTFAEKINQTKKLLSLELQKQQSRREEIMKRNEDLYLHFLLTPFILIFILVLAIVVIPLIDLLFKFLLHFLIFSMKNECHSTNISAPSIMSSPILCSHHMLDVHSQDGFM